MVDILFIEKYDFDKHQVKKSILNNKHNNQTTTYYLLYQKFQSQGILDKNDELDLLSDEEQTQMNQKEVEEELAELDNIDSNNENQIEYNQQVLSQTQKVDQETK